MNCNQVRDLIPYFALGALEPAGLLAVEAHLEECPDCTVPAREHLTVSAALASVAPTVEPPASLRHRLMAAVSAQAPYQVPHTAPAPASAATAMGWRRWAAWRPSILGAAASASLVLAIVVLGLLLDVRSDLRELQATNADLMEVAKDQRDFSYVASMPGVVPVALQGSGETPKARGMLMASPDHTWGVLYSLGLEPQREEMAYQVWLVRNGIRWSGGMFNVDDTGYGHVYIRFPASLDNFSEIGVTEEPLQGSLSPSSEPILKAQIAAVQ